MTQFITDIRQTIVPGRNTRHGPLPPLLVSMTLVTGLVDAFSYLVLGHVFVANITGNVVLLRLRWLVRRDSRLRHRWQPWQRLEWAHSSAGRSDHDSPGIGAGCSASRHRFKQCSLSSV